MASSISPEKLKALQNKAAEQVKAQWERSNIVQLDKEKRLPRFTREQLGKGSFLGKGGFCTVDTIKGFKANNVTLKQTDEEVPFEDKDFIITHWKRANGDERYAIKYLSPEVIADTPRFLQGIVDFATETHFLTAIDHPNIVKLRAVAEGTPFSKSYFLVLDRLYDILDTKIPKWGKQSKRIKGAGKLMDRGGKKSKALLEERLVAAHDLSDAIGYMHKRNIVYRDIKPENIGFSIKGDITVFDFGLTKELHDVDKLADGTWKLSGHTGSLRYMAPEVYKTQPYNYSCDVYAFAVLLWEIMAMEKPFATYSLKLHESKVIMGGHRPKVNEKWSAGIRDIMERGWSEDLSVRPTMESIKEILRKEIADIRSG